MGASWTFVPTVLPLYGISSKFISAFHLALSEGLKHGKGEGRGNPNSALVPGHVAGPGGVVTGQT